MARRTTVLLATSLLLTGCGGAKSNGYAEKPPNEVVKAAERAALAAKSVHITGTIVDGGTPLSLDLTLVHGRTGKGKLTQRGVSFDVVRVGDKVYLRGSDAFWREFASEAAVALLHGKWVTGPADRGQLSEVAELLDQKELFTSAFRQHGKLANKGEVEYKGDTVVEIDDTTEGGKLYVSAKGEPYPVAIVGGKSDGRISFTEWNAEVDVTAPEGAVDVTQFGR